MQLQRISFQPIGFKALCNKELMGFFAGEHNTQVDLFETRQGFSIGNRSLQQSLAYTFPTHLLCHIHPPNDALVMSLALHFSPETSNTNQRRPLEHTESRVVRSSIPFAKTLRDTSDASF